MMTIIDAQRDMRKAYFDGAPGVVASGCAWLLAGVVALVFSAFNGMLTLIFAGMLIFPVSVVLCKLLGRTGKHQKGNPLAPLAIEGTFWMLLLIPVAVAVSLYKLEWFFPAMIMVIAGRYLTFSTLYGLRIFWAFSGVLVLAAVGLVALNAPVYAGALAGGLIEWAFALVIFRVPAKTRQLQ